MPLPRYDFSVMDNVPRPVPGANVAVYAQPTTPNPITPANFNPAVDTPLATIYSDSAGSVPLANPFQADGTGNGFFYAASITLYTVVFYGGTLASPVVLIDQNLGAFTAGVLMKTNGSSNSVQSLLDLVAGTNVTLSQTNGHVTISSTAAPVALQTNGSTNASQVKLNLVQGTGITIAQSAGNTTITGTAAATFKTNGTPNGSQSILNLAAGTHLTITDGGTGTDTFDVAWPVFQVNATPLTSSSTINYQNGSNIAITNPSAGNVAVAVTGITDAVKFVSFSIAAAVIKTLRATPVQILAAPGLLKQFIIQKVVMEFVPATTPFATVSTADLAVYVATTKATAFTGDSTGLIDQTVKTFELVSPSAAKIFTTATLSVNEPLMIANVAGAEYTAGDGALIVNVYYTTLTTT